MNYKEKMKFDTTKSDGQYKTAVIKSLKQYPNFKFVDIKEGLTIQSNGL